METGIVKPGETSLQRRELSPSLSKQKEILTLLTKCSLRRGAAVNPETLAIYAQDLSSYELEHIAAVLDEIGQEEPEDYKQLWPAIGTFLGAIRGRIRASRPTSEQVAKDKWDAYVKACAKEGIEAPDPEILARIAELNRKLGLKVEFAGEVVEASHEAKL